MRFELEILDGKNKGRRLMLRNGLMIGRGPKKDPTVAPELQQQKIAFDDPEMAEAHVVINYDSNKSWNIECLAPNKIRLGFAEVERAVLIVGLIFNIGQTGFKVVEHEAKNKGPWKEELKAWLEKNPGYPSSTEIFFFSRPIRLSFIQGPQYEEAYTLSYGPRELGYNCLDLDIKDPSSPPRVAKFFQIGAQVYIENLCGAAATINGGAFEQHKIAQGDVLRIGSSTIELSTL
ncbi:MAG: FHA domain-containing protein [Bdellovibrionota bacterium]